MKKNWTQMLSLALGIVLLIAAAAQWTVVSGLREELADSRQALDALTERLDEAEAALETVQAAQSRPAPSVRFANASVDTENRRLTVDIVAELPDEDDYSPGIGFCQVGEPYRLAWKVDCLRRNEDGTYGMTATFPLDLEMGLELRLEDDTVLFSSDSVAELLPLRFDYGGTSWHFSSQSELFYQCDWGVGMMDTAGDEAQASDGEFRVYRNGTLVFTGRQMPDNSRVEVDGEILDGVGLDCVQGDCMRLCYACTDTFGLRYEFPIFEKRAMKWDQTEDVPLSRRPTVAWPE